MSSSTKTLVGLSQEERWQIIQPVIPKLSRAQQALYLYLHGMVKPGDDDVWASIKTLASSKHLNWKERYLKQIMNELKELGLVERVPRGDHVSATVLLIPPKQLGGATRTTGATGTTPNHKRVQPGPPPIKRGATGTTVSHSFRSQRLSPKAKATREAEAEPGSSNANARAGGIYQSKVQASVARMRTRPHPRVPAPVRPPAPAPRIREIINELDGIALDADERFAYQTWRIKFDDERAKELLRSKRSREAAA